MKRNSSYPEVDLDAIRNYLIIDKKWFEFNALKTREGEQAAQSLQPALNHFWGLLTRKERSLINMSKRAVAASREDRELAYNEIEFRMAGRIMQALQLHDE